ncbi:hypothetical protein PDIG_48710 [Penicillium digitatum PHI26]|uniref:Uncharacterized protein n=2 Tax=Penicillium digitatum TaxID=36651 RepID=K9FRD9_PEND2|nr:hypothetical protein PDIP_58090 [Penicillium digitatum Pd1]EKV10974.1 hypothetical protein PDIP_58090 [Penicillium digitatum Pd1]EKV11739.1 hypothetical protein PDIG_48710 [Penicillium digitatum PHI26]
MYKQKLKTLPDLSLELLLMISNNLSRLRQPQIAGLLGSWMPQPTKEPHAGAR